MDNTAPRVRERTVLTVFDHSGRAPRAIAEVELVAEPGQPPRRPERVLTTSSSCTSRPIVGVSAWA